MILHGIATKPVKKGPMVPVETGTITSTGLEGNYYGTIRNFAKPYRQVTVLSLDQWGLAMKELGTNIEWHMRRANLCISGYEFSPSDVGRTICVGDAAMLYIMGECDPCRRMDEVHAGLMKALMPEFRAGVICQVRRQGWIRVGDTVRVE